MRKTRAEVRRAAPPRLRCPNPECKSLRIWAYKTTTKFNGKKIRYQKCRDCEALLIERE